MLDAKEILKQMYLAYAHWACKRFPYLLGPMLAQFEYVRIRGGRMNLKHPKNLTEKIVWMQFHTDTSLWTICADKYRVREYVAQKGLEEILPELYGKWDDVNEIDIDNLPKSFVLKTNNSSGQVLIVKDKTEINRAYAKATLQKWLNLEYGSHNAQLHYMRIKPCVIAEELLVDTKLEQDVSLTDYKIWCFNGIPNSILVVANRKHTTGVYDLKMYDTEWNDISEKAIKLCSTHHSDKRIEKPQNLSEMLKYARILSAGFPEVRVDFYDINGKIYFGELTFTAGYGNYSDDYLKYMGSLVDLTQISKVR